MTITVSLKVSNERSWDHIADKSASLEMPVTEADANWKDAVECKLAFFMQEAADMLIPAVKGAIEDYATVDEETADVEDPAAPSTPASTVPEGESNAPDSLHNQEA